MPPAASTSNIPNNLPPLRSLDDFLLGSARFQLPNFRDLDKWGNRVVKNLLYYQTNYVLLFISIYILMGILYPTKIICGIFVKFLIFGTFLTFFTDDSKFNVNISRHVQHSKNKYYLIGAVIIGYLILLWFDSILISAFTLLLPLGLTFIHASLRLRNIKNKIVNEIMEVCPPNTPMSVILNSLNIACDKIASQTSASLSSLKKQ